MLAGQKATLDRQTMRISTLVLALVLALASAAPAEFEVKSLPGWNGPLLSKTYCGFSPAGTPPSGSGNMYFNYIFMESENDPKNDPVVVWYNVSESLVLPPQMCAHD